MNSPSGSFRHAGPQQLAGYLQGARDYTLTLFDCLAQAGFGALNRVPHLATINPPLWELGHTAWFAEWFILREAASSHPAAAQRACLLTCGDDWFDSNTVPHRTRWTLDLPLAPALKTYCREVLDRTLHELSRVPPDDATLYPYRLALAHEDMHGEALLYTMQTLGVSPPAGVAAPGMREAALPYPTPAQDMVPPGGGAGPGAHGEAAAPPDADTRSELAFGGGPFLSGASDSGGFVFDNERGAQPCSVAPFRIDAALVTNAQFSRFVDDGGYQDPRFWSAAGHAWLMGQERSAPRYWQRDGAQWRTERWGQPAPLAATEPVRHVTLYEAQAYCAWAGRRLPTEIEWEYAAASDAGLGWGQLWEWTASPFNAHPGFAADRYREYSAPWFGTHQVLRGASFATPPRLASVHFRNFYMPARDDIFAGFRTCAS